MTAPTRLVVNQNYYQDWRAGDGRPVTSLDGLLSVAVGPEDRSIELRFRRPSFTAGLWVSVLSSFAAVAVLAGRKPREVLR